MTPVVRNDPRGRLEFSSVSHRNVRVFWRTTTGLCKKLFVMATILPFS